MSAPNNPDNNLSFHSNPPGYHSYLLRFWQERSEQSASSLWRFSLEDPLTEQRYGFGDLDALVTFIQAQISLSQTTDSDLI